MDGDFEMATHLGEAERIWTRLKVVAATAKEQNTTIGEHEAYVLVDSIVHDEHAPSTPREAREYFAKELRAMVSQRFVDAAT